MYWHHNDHLGTPQVLTNRDGTVVWTASYTPFGIATINRDPDGDAKEVWNRFRFPGQYWDWETQTHYNYFRTYDPATGRYTQHDPIGLDGGMNPFGYVWGNPITYVDPNGLYVGGIGIGASGTIGGALGGVSAGGDISLVWDDDGNMAVVSCGGGGVSSSSGSSYFAGGVITNIWGADTICDLVSGDLSPAVTLTGGSGLVGGFTSTGLSGNVSGIGVSGGASSRTFGGGTGGCKILWVIRGSSCNGNCPKKAK